MNKLKMTTCLLLQVTETTAQEIAVDSPTKIMPSLAPSQKMAPNFF